jgi:hypothetical protein
LVGEDEVEADALAAAELVAGKTLAVGAALADVAEALG